MNASKWSLRVGTSMKVFTTGGTKVLKVFRITKAGVEAIKEGCDPLAHGYEFFGIQWLRTYYGKSWEMA
jgi:hypothetical protein